MNISDPAKMTDEKWIPLALEVVAVFKISPSKWD